MSYDLGNCGKIVATPFCKFCVVIYLWEEAYCFTHLGG